MYPVKLLFQTSSVLGTEEHTFAEEIEKHMIAGFSVLELHLTTNGHAFGALVFHLLKMVRICGSIRRLKVVLERSTVTRCFSYIYLNNTMCSSSPV